MTITREQAIELAKKHKYAAGHPHLTDEWILDAIIEASQPIADVQAEGSYPALPQPLRLYSTLNRDGDRLNVHGFTADQMRAFADATVAHRQRQAETCEWHPDDNEDGLWQSSCGGDPWLFEHDGPIENHCKFCMHCGKIMTFRAAAKGGE